MTRDTCEPSPDRRPDAPAQMAAKLILVQPALSYAAGLGNLRLLAQLLDEHKAALAPDDIVLLPEHVVLDGARDPYLREIGQLARRLGCHVVGGSHHQQRGQIKRNVGAVSDARGQIVAQYEKLRPYAGERERVEAGTALGELTIGGLRVLVLICADFWFSDVFTRAQALPDVVLVPAHSVSRKPDPSYSRALWRHLAVARAYEFGVYVGISDWAYIRAPGALPPSGVAGFADPTTPDEAQLFAALGQQRSRVFTLDRARLEAFRADRLARGFFWKKPQP